MKRTMLEATPIMVVLAVLITFVLTAPSNSIGSTASQNANSATTMQNSNRGMGHSSSDELSLGTWKLNEAKSKFGAGSPKNHTVVYEAAGDDIKVTVDGVDSAGSATHSEWTGKFDGKYYAVTGDPNSDMRSYRRINKTTMTLTAKKGDKVTAVVNPLRNGDPGSLLSRITLADGRVLGNGGPAGVGPGVPAAAPTPRP